MQDIQQSAVNIDPKRLLMQAKKERAEKFDNALQNDVGNQRKRVRYLQNLQKQRIEQKKLD